MKKNIFELYATAVAKQFHLNLDQMFSDTRRRDIVDARQMLYYLCMERPIRVSYIQRFLSEHGYEVYHSTILHGYKKAKEQVQKDPDYKAVVDLIELENLKIPSV
jgi:chromosomal replication initiation ATPase DnaA